ncbi:MAG: ATP phosphoribosyltransferase regulatory subunit, partial [Maritimibacter sp.]
MSDKFAIRAEAARLSAFFEAQGALPVDPPILQPAETLLDLYGEDIRARAFVTTDPVMGEAMLRPDFTVPVVEMHMANGADPARYTYAGEVFRKQEEATHRAPEYIQVGYELFDRTDPAAADAEVFALMAEALAPLGLRAATGDIGILIAAVRGLSTTEKRKAALIRHLWRPRRFRALLDRFAGRAPMPAGREELLAKADPMAIDAP